MDDRYLGVCKLELKIWLVDFSNVDKTILKDCLKQSRFPGASLDINFEGDFKIQQILSDISLRYMLSQFMEIEMSSWSFVKSSWGKPAIATSGYESIKFNISHSEKHLALILAPTNCTEVINVGIDIESHSRCSQAYRLKDEFLCNQELSILNLMNRNTVEKTALKCWTLKEAFSKAIGYGMAMPFRSIQMDMQQNKIVEIDDFKGRSFKSSTFHLESFEPKNSFQLSYCVESKTDLGQPIQIIQMSANDILTAYFEKAKPLAA